MSIEPGSVLLATPRWTRDGGVATHLIASATALVQRGVTVHAVAARIESEPIPGVTLHHAPDLFKQHVSPELRLGEAASLIPSVIHLHQFDDPEVLTVMQAIAPVVISVHGYSACTSGVHYFGPGQECTRAHGPGCVPNLALRGCAHTRDPRTLPPGYRRATRAVQALRRADLAISYSSTIDRHLATNGVVRRTIVPLFATISPVAATGHAARRRVVFAGRVVTPKGIGVLVRAARRVDGEFVICGDGWQLEAMRRLARRLCVQERVRFTGWLAAQDLARELAQASVVAMPSLWPEPFGLVGIEAHAAGRPVVASATGGVADWLQDGISGLSVTPGDEQALAAALNELLADPARQAAMGEAGRKLVAARYTPKHHVDALMRAYRSARTTWESNRRRESNRGEVPARAGARPTPPEPSQV
jgi:glycosyltransferase involved in cell wall biosynthesis